MKFRYEFDIPRLQPPITHRSGLFLVGSCFTENIGEKFERYKFKVVQNPHGILFNPISVASALTDYIEERQYTETDLFTLNEAWHSWNHHSRFSGHTPAEALQKINRSISEAHAFLKMANYVVITLGSAWTYALTGEASKGRVGQVAANNHKAPASWFNRKLLTQEAVLQALDNLMHRLLLFNPGLRIIFTISPVRHLREGAVENNRSKAVLIQAVHHLVDKFDRLYYFPAYELVIDDLRDYRFFAEDLVHPNYFATEYVWNRLVQACMPEATRKLIDELHSLHLAFTHKPFHPTSSQHRAFLESAHRKAALLREQHPYLDLEKELAYFSTGGS
jgi:hypothetical protein